MCAAPHIVWSAIFIVVPLIMVFYYAFTDKSGAFTLDNVTRLTNYTSTFLRSLWFGIVATIICLLIAYPLAYILSKMKLRAQSTMVMLVMIPMWMNFLLRTYAWMTILETESGLINTVLKSIGLAPLQLINTQGAVILGMVYNYIPFMIIPLYSIMTKIDKRVIEAAYDLGAHPVSVLTKVIVPLSFPGITQGITMTFVPAVSTFVISQLLGGAGNTLIGDLIERQFVSGGEYNPHYGSAISLLLMIVVLICMGIFNQFDNEEMEDTLA